MAALAASAPTVSCAPGNGPSNGRLARPAASAATIPTGTPAPADATTTRASTGASGHTLVARRPARAASHTNPIVRAIGTR